MRTDCAVAQPDPEVGLGVLVQPLNVCERVVGPQEPLKVVLGDAALDRYLQPHAGLDDVEDLPRGQVKARLQRMQRRVGAVGPARLLSGVGGGGIAQWRVEPERAGIALEPGIVQQAAWLEPDHRLEALARARGRPPASGMVGLSHTAQPVPATACTGCPWRRR